MNYFWHFQHDDFYWVLHYVPKASLIPQTNRLEAGEYLNRWLPAVSWHYNSVKEKRGNRTITESIVYGVCQWFPAQRHRFCPSISLETFENEPNIDEWSFVFRLDFIHNNYQNKMSALKAQRVRVERLKNCNALTLNVTRLASIVGD